MLDASLQGDTTDTVADMEATLTDFPPPTNGLGAAEPEESSVPLPERILNNAGNMQALGFKSEWKSTSESLTTVAHELKSPRGDKAIHTVNNGNQLVITSGGRSIVADTTGLALPTDLQAGKVELNVYLALASDPSKWLTHKRGHFRCIARGETIAMANCPPTPFLIHAILGMKNGGSLNGHKWLMVGFLLESPEDTYQVTTPPPHHPTTPPSHHPTIPPSHYPTTSHHPTTTTTTRSPSFLNTMSLPSSCIPPTALP